MKQVVLIVIATVLLIFGTIQSYKFLPHLVNDKFRGSFNMSFDDSKTHSNLYAPRDLKITRIADSKVEVSWGFDRKEFVVDSTLPQEYAVLSGFRIYKDGFWHKDILGLDKKFIDEDLLPNETYEYAVSALTFDNKIEGIKSENVNYKTPNFALNIINFPVSDIKKYLAEGDSITKAEGIEKGQGWSEKVASNYGFEIFNRALSGSTSFSVNDRITKEIEEIDPDLVTIAVGVNDMFTTDSELGNISMSDYHDNLKSIVKKAKVGRDRNVVLLNIFYVNCCEEKHKVWDKEIRGVANSLGILYIDVSSPMIKNGGKTLLMGDLHPNSEGHRIISEAVIGELNKFME